MVHPLSLVVGALRQLTSTLSRSLGRSLPGSRGAQG